MANPFAETPPPLPPKHSAPSRRQQQHQSLPPTRSTTRNDSSHAHHSSRSADAPARTRPNRSQTTGPPPSSGSRPQATQPRRSHSSDSTPSDKSKHHRSKTKKEKGSMHADVIDRLDFTGVGPMFHHDGPFDACAPSRNRHRTKAPMYAWTAINPEDEEVAARYRDDQAGPNPVAPALAYNHSYPSEVPRSPPAAANYDTYYSEPPKKKVDAIAEAWGIHEPEPYEEFFAGGGDSDGPTSGNTIKEARSNGRRTREDVTSRPRGANRIPPPQPIFVRDRPEPEYPAQPSPGSGGANLGRNRSIIQRIRRMRDSPNVPVGFDESMDTGADGVPSPTSSTESSHGRQAHRRGDSFLGRFTRGRGDALPASPVEPYVYVDDRTKELPPTPVSPINRYSDGPSSPGAGLGRTTSILKKVRGVVRGSK